MITFDHPLLLLLILPVGIVTWLIWRNGYANLSRRRGRVALGVRLALLLCIVLGLAGMGLSLSQSSQTTVVVADLSASDARAKSELSSAIDRAARQRPSGDLMGVISVGRDPRVEQPPLPLSGFDGFQTQVDPNYTNLQDGLSLGNAILPDGYRRRVTLMTDGQENVGDALSTARLLRSLGVRVDVWPIHVTSGPEVMLDSVAMPSQLRPQERFSVTVSVRSTVATTGTLVLYRDRTLIASRKERITIGENQYVFPQAPLHSGFHAYRAHIYPARDTQAQNNVGSTFSVVAGTPRVLVTSPSRAEARNVLNSLHSTGIAADFQSPGDVDPSLSSLQHYAAVVLVDTPVDALDPELVSNLVPYVRDLGHGLVVIGGRESYGMGGYGQTGLEEALPVRMNLPKRKDLPSVAVVLIIENLESDQDVNISKEAGKGVVGLLTPQDQIAVNDALENGTFPVPLQHVTNKGAIDHAIDQMQPGDPASYVTDLQAAYRTLRHTNARVKHIILLGDGDAEDLGYEQVVKQIRAGGVTVSTVGTNGLGFYDWQTMRNIARWGGGRFYPGDNSSDIPQIFVREARTVARSGYVEGRFYPQEVSPNPMLQDVKSVPPLSGYVATTPKPTGEMVLVSKKQDPVLAGWQFGLGRSVVWTSDAAGLWTRDWLQAPGANRFWANLVSWTLPPAQHGQLAMSASTGGGEGHIAVDVPPSLGANPNVTAHVLGPDLRTTTVQLQPTAPGHFTGSFLSGAPGAYFVTADARGASHAEAGQTGVDVPYSAEYRTDGTNTPFLRALADAGGGSVVTTTGAFWANNLQAVYSRQSLQNWLWLLALLLLPIDIAARRLIVTASDLRAIRAALTGFRQPETSGASLVSSLQAARQRRTERAPAAVRAPARLTVSPVPTSRPAAPAGVPAHKTPQPVKQKQAPAGSAPSAPTTTSQLLAAKRKRK